MTEIDVTTTVIDPTKLEPSKTATVDTKELQEAGYLQEVNRQFFHPLGLALAVDHDGKAPLMVLDNRDDPEGMFFSEEQLNTPDAEGKAMRVANVEGRQTYRRVT